MLKRRLIRSVEKLEAMKMGYRKNARPLDCLLYTSDAADE